MLDLGWDLAVLSFGVIGGAAVPLGAPLTREASEAVVIFVMSAVLLSLFCIAVIGRLQADTRPAVIAFSGLGLGGLSLGPSLFVWVALL
jgi:hypothetical protein